MSLDLSWSEIHWRIITQICVCVVVYILCAVIVIVIHCRRGSVCLRVCLVILMCYISLSAVVYERFRRAKQYLKQHYLNIKRDSHLSLHQRIVWNNSWSTISAACTHSQCLPHSKSREHLEADYKWWASLLLASLTIVVRFWIFAQLRT